VLVIDDDEAIRAYLSSPTQDHAETIEAASGDKGISVTKSRVPNLILLDLMSAKTDHAFEAAALKLGAIYYIVKPFDTNIVASKLKIILRSSNGARSLTPLFGDAEIRAT